jgi:hypothetical protein
MVTPGNDQSGAAEPFPVLNGPLTPALRCQSTATPNRSREQSDASTLTGRLRSASKRFEESSPPTGMWIATGEIASSVPSLGQIRRGSYTSDGWSGEGQVVEKERRASIVRKNSAQNVNDDNSRRRGSTNPSSPKNNLGNELDVPETVQEADHQGLSSAENSEAINKETGMNRSRAYRSSSDTNISPNAPNTKPDGGPGTTPFENGYQFPPKHTWGEATIIFLKAAAKFVSTPIGFLITIYGLNVVAWGGMLFLLLCNASPAMCHPSCGNINSPRRIWIEIDSQILNALFCVTGFGTIPWRFRDLYFLLQYRIYKNEMGLRKLAGINRSWLRLAGSEDLPITLAPVNIEVEFSNVPENSIPFPITKIPNAPLTGIRAPATALWRLDFVIWAMVWNTFLQAVLSGFMWGLNRYTRPSWSTGLFVALACIVAACGGIMTLVEGKKVKSIEGVPISEADQERLRQDREAGITHWNNINDEKPKEPKGPEKKGLFHRDHKEAGLFNEDNVIGGDDQVVR